MACVEQAVIELEGWSRGDWNAVCRAAPLIETIAGRAATELPALARLPQRDAVALWLNLTSLAKSAGAHLIGITAVTTELQRARVRSSVRRVVSTSAKLVEITVARAEVARRLAG